MHKRINGLKLASALVQSRDARSMPDLSEDKALVRFVRERAETYGALRKSALTAIALDRAADRIAALSAPASVPDAVREALSECANALDANIERRYRGRTFPGAGPEYEQEMAVVDRARSALAAPASPVPSGWRTIDSAPRDQLIDLWVVFTDWQGREEGGRSVNCRWRAESVTYREGWHDGGGSLIEWRVDFAVAEAEECHPGNGRRVSHWMPLPAAPSNTEQGEGEGRSPSLDRAPEAAQPAAAST